MEYLDPISRLNFSFNKDEVISAYLRRSNGKKRLVFSSRSPTKAFEYYHTMKIFKGDRKYLCIKVNGIDVNLLSMSGVDQRPITPRLGAKRDVNFHHVTLPNIVRVPKTLVDTINKILKSQIIPGTSLIISRNKLIPMLLAYYASLNPEERNEINKKSHNEYIKQKVKSGANIDKYAQNLMMEEDIEDDLL